jgi:propionyl-CoA synthetase
MVHRQLAAHSASLQDPETFWLPLARDLIAWIKPPSRALTPGTSTGKWAWFPDGTLNTCYNCVDRHPASRVAIQYVSAMAGTTETITYAKLRQRVEAVAGVLKHELGVKKGDTVIIYSMTCCGSGVDDVVPMIPEAIYGMLACARIGAVHSVVFGGFAAAELAKRIEDSKAEIVLTGSCGIEPRGVIPYKRMLVAV